MGWQDIRIETERPILRLPQAGDFAGWAAFFADPEAMRHMGGPRSEPLGWRHFLMMVGAWSIQGASSFVIHLITPDNHPSQAVARRLGSSVLRRIEMPEPFHGEVVDAWGQSRDAWLRRRA